MSSAVSVSLDGCSHIQSVPVSSTYYSGCQNIRTYLGDRPATVGTWCHRWQAGRLAGWQAGRQAGRQAEQFEQLAAEYVVLTYDGWFSFERRFPKGQNCVCLFRQ